MDPTALSRPSSPPGPARSTTPSYSADGTRLAFVSDRDGDKVCEDPDPFEGGGQPSCYGAPELYTAQLGRRARRSGSPAVRMSSCTRPGRPTDRRSPIAVAKAPLSAWKSARSGLSTRWDRSDRAHQFRSGSRTEVVPETAPRSPSTPNVTTRRDLLRRARRLRRNESQPESARRWPRALLTGRLTPSGWSSIAGGTTVRSDARPVHHGQRRL